MSIIKLKKTLNLHRFSVRVNDVFANWKIALPTIISVIGMVAGSYTAKGEGWTYSFIGRYIKLFLTEKTDVNFLSDIIIMFLIPASFAIILFFCGLSVFGGFIANAVPFLYSFIIGVTSYYFYLNYTLKGLAYCVILIFPYAVLSLFSLILMTGECINMSEYLVNKTNRKNSIYDYSFKLYYLNFMKSFVFIVIAVIIKILLDTLFIGIFSF